MTTEDEDTKDFLENVHRRQRLEREAYLTARQTRDSKVDETKVDETKPSEPIVNEKKPRKVVGRSVAIALGIVCILLIAGLGGAMAYYTTTINDKNNKIDSINAQLAAITGNNSNKNATEIIDQLNANITNLNNQVTQLQAELKGNEKLLSETQTWLSGNVTAYNNEVTLYTNELNQYNSYVADHTHTDEDYNNIASIVSLSDSYAVASDKTVEEGNGAYYTFTLSANYAGYVTILVDSSTVSGTWTEVIYTSHGVNYNQEITVNAGSSSVFPVLPSSRITIGVGNGLGWPSNGATETVTITYYF